VQFAIKKPQECCLNLKKSKSENIYCSRSCSAIYFNKNKKTGTRRSKFEQWVEYELTIKYNDLKFIFNKMNHINYELDIYIPVLELAFEINGVFHYRPIYGENKFISTINHDLNKYNLCKDSGIKLISVDISTLASFNILKSKPYLEQITNHIDDRLYF
jgi:hypothetical protein